MANNIKGLTVEIGGDTTKLGKALEDVNKKSRNLSSELGDINRLLKLDPGNTDLLAQKQKVLADAIKNTSKKLETLKDAEKQVQQQFEKGEVSEEQVRALQREIVATEKKMDSYKNAVKETEQALRGVGDESKEVKDHTGKLGAALGNAAKVGFAAVTAAAAAAVTGLVAAAESTREYRTEMSKLDTAFTQNGFTAEAAKGAYKELQGVLGETDQAVEAANHLAKLTENEKDLATWTGDILPGVYATFGASLPIEGLTEAANETAKVGQVTGPLADALNWAGVNEDKFNEKLEKCNSEQERAALITETLTGLYGEASEAYKEQNADVIEANKANEAWMESLAGIGGAVEPIITDVKMMGASLLSDLVPGVEKLAEAFGGLMSGDAGAASEMGTVLSDMVKGLLDKVANLLPTLLQVGGQIISNLATGIVTNLPVLAQKAMDAIGGFVNGFQTYLPLVLNKGAELLGKLGEGISTGLPNLVSQALDILMRFAETIYNNAPKLIQTGFDLLKNLVQGVLNSLPALLSKGPEIISKFANVINDNFPTILKKGFELIVQIIKGIISAIPTLIANIPKIITAIVDVWEAFNWLNLGKKAIDLMKNGITSMFGAIKNAGKGVMDSCTNAIKSLPSKLLNLGKQAVSGLGNAIRSGLGTVKSAAKVIFDGVVTYFKNLPSQLLSIGKDMIRGLWDGISSMAGWVMDKIEGFASGILSKLKGVFKIASPSKETAWMGEMLDEGLAQGITDYAKQPIQAMQKLSGNVLGAVDTVGGVSFERNLQQPRIASAGSAFSGGMGDTSALLAKLDGIYERLNHLQVVTETGALVGEIIDKVDGALATRQLLSARGV